MDSTNILIPRKYCLVISLLLMFVVVRQEWWINEFESELFIVVEYVFMLHESATQAMIASAHFSDDTGFAKKHLLSSLASSLDASGKFVATVWLEG